MQSDERGGVVTTAQPDSRDERVGGGTRGQAAPTDSRGEPVRADVGGEDSRPAVLIDRDGTIIRERHYLADPKGVELIPGAAAALRSLAEAGYALVVVTNQSGIARGIVSPAQYAAVRGRVHEVLSAEGVQLDAVYHCPHHPDWTGPCACRKPGLALYRQAASELGLDLARSCYIGDKVSDVLPAVELGGAGYLVRTGHGAEQAAGAPEGVRVASDIAAAARWILADRRR